MNYLDENGLLYFAQKIKGWLGDKADSSSLSTVATSGKYTDLTNRPTIPTNNNQLTNGAGYQTSSQVETAITNKGYQTSQQVQSAISAAIADISGLTFSIVQELPATGDTGTIYLVPKTTAATNNSYSEYIYYNNAWELIGDTSVDLSGYLKAADCTAITNAQIDTACV